jgi:DNA-nicking Smr family endonuclease
VAATVQRRLTPEEAEIWAKVAASVRRLEGASPSIPPVRFEPSREPLSSVSENPRLRSTQPLDFARGERKVEGGDTLDGGWDRRLRRGVVIPDRSIDLHGHTLASAHNLLDQALERAVTDGLRVLLVVTGKPPRDPAPHRRGLIRAAIGDWLGSSRHTSQIAAVRNAHPRHGGTGALYVILRRARTG